MAYSDYENLRDIHYLSNYEPEETRYARFAAKEPSIIATGHKIIDTYRSSCSARGLLFYSYSKDWGDLSSSDEASKLYAKSQMLIASLIGYSITMDMTWQVIWASFQPTSLELLLEGNFKKMEQHCDGPNVHVQLNSCIAQHGAGAQLAQNTKDLLTNIENNLTCQKVRNIYNAIKNRGSIHIQGLGMNDSTLNFSYKGKRISKPYRDSFSVDKIETLLLDYDRLLADFIVALEQMLLPNDYKEMKCDFQTLIQGALDLTINRDCS